MHTMRAVGGGFRGLAVLFSDHMLIPGVSAATAPRRAIAVAACWLAATFCSSVSLGGVLTSETVSLRQANPGLQTAVEGGRLTALYGVPLASRADYATATSTREFVDAFLDAHADAFGVDAVELQFKDSIKIRNDELEVFTYEQKVGVLPVNATRTKIVVLLGDVPQVVPDKITHASFQLVPIPVGSGGAASGGLSAADAIQIVDDSPTYVNLTNFDDPANAEKVIFEDSVEVLHETWRFSGWGDDELYLFFVDTTSSEIVSAESQVDEADVSGTVTGKATPCLPQGDPFCKVCNSGDNEGMQCVFDTDCPPSPPLGACMFSASGCCPADDPTKPATDPQTTGMNGIRITIDEYPLIEEYAESDGTYGPITGLSGAVTMRSKLIGEWVAVQDAAGGDLEEFGPGNPPSFVGLTFNDLASEAGTAQINAFLGVQATHDWFHNLQPNYVAIDFQLPVAVNVTAGAPGFRLNNLCSAAYYREPFVKIEFTKATNPVCNNAATATIIAHEYGHFILRRNMTAIPGDFSESIADVVGTFSMDTPLLGLGFRTDNGLVSGRNVDQPDVRLHDSATFPTWCPTFERCDGLSMSGAFWDLRKQLLRCEDGTGQGISCATDDNCAPGITCTDGSEADRIFADFLFITDGVMDESVVVEVLVADDDDGDLWTETPHYDEIITAFVDLHGWTAPLQAAGLCVNSGTIGNPCYCPGGACAVASATCNGGTNAARPCVVGGECPSPGACTDTVKAEWVGPVTPFDEPNPNEDYFVHYEVSPPMIVLVTTEKGGDNVLRWRVGRTDPVTGDPFDLGVVTAQWAAPSILDIPVEIGTTATTPCRNVDIIDIPAQSAAHWSSIVLRAGGVCEGASPGAPCDEHADCAAGDTCSAGDLDPVCFDGPQRGEDCVNPVIDCARHTCSAGNLLRVTAEAVAGGTSGGRISGTVSGTAGELVAQAIGLGSGSLGGTIDVTGRVNRVKLANHPASSALVADRVGVSLDVAGPFDGELAVHGDLNGTCESGGFLDKACDGECGCVPAALNLNTSGGTESTGQILVDGDIREIASITVTGDMSATAKIHADADDSGQGAILGNVTVTGRFSGDICGTNMCWAIPLSTYPNISISDFQGTICEYRDQPQATEVTAETIGTEDNIKNRFLSFAGANTGRLTAIRVTFFDLPPPFNTWNASEMWVGPPSDVSEVGARVDPLEGDATFKAARLQCDPHYADWGALGTVHVFHEGVVPNGVYDVQAVLCGKASTPHPEEAFSIIETITTAEKWGDTMKDFLTYPPGPPEGEVNIVDILAIIGAFQNASGAIVKARADLEPNCLDLVINVTDALKGIDGFAGLSYPFIRTANNPCASTCVNPLP